MRLRRPLGLFSLGLGLLGVSCLPGGRLPMAGPPPTRGATPLRPVEADLPPDEGPLKLAFASPQGDEVAAPLPTFVFTRSMHRLGDPPGEPPVAARFDPPVEGSWHWVGSRALQFSPRGAFAPATRYRIALPPGLKSLDGQTLDGETTLEFATPRLRVGSASLGDEPDGKLWISFNQKVAPEALLKALAVADEDGRKILLRGFGKEPSSSFELLPARRWPDNVEIRAKITPPLQGAEGPLGLAEPFSQTFRERTLSTVDSLRCWQEREEGICEEGTEIGISLSDAMTVAALRPLVRVEPPVPFTLKPSDTSAPQEPQSTFELSGKFKLGVPYKVIVRSSTVRQRGRPGLDRGATLSFRTAPPLPWITTHFRGTYLHPSWTKPLQASTHRVRAARFSVTPLTPEDILEARVAHKPVAPKALASEQKRREVSADPRKEEGTVVDLGELFPSKPGPVLLQSHGEGPDGETSRSEILQRTDLTLSARLSPESSLFWVTRLLSAEPVKGAEVTVHDLAGRKVSGTTDDQGIVLLDTRPLAAGESGAKRLRNEPSLFITARSGDDWIYTERSLPRPPRPEAVLFADRGLYRPGETVHLKGVVRIPTSRGLVTPPEGHEVRLVLRIPGSSEVAILKKLSSWGTFSHDVDLPPGMPPSRASFAIEEESSTLARTQVQVHHIRPLTFQVSAALDRTAYGHGDAFTCSSRATYLYGGSMQGMRSLLAATLTSTGYTVPELEGFFVGRSRWGGRSPMPLGSKRERLDAGGSARLTGSLAREPFDEPMHLSCEAEVSDPGEQSLEARAGAIVHPAEFYVALRERSWHVEPGEEMKVEALAVTPEGKRRSEKIRIELKRLQPGGEPSVTLGSCDLLTGAAPVVCALRAPKEHGTAFLLQATATDRQGYKTTTAASGATSPPPPRNAPPRRPRTTPPTAPPPLLPPPPPPFLVGPDETLRPGQSATLAVNPRGSAGQGLLTLEREGIFGHLLLGASNRATVAIEETMAPWFSAAVERVYPTSPEVPYTSPGLLFEEGSVSLRVEGADRMLRVKVVPSKEQAAPGDRVDVEVQVADPQGRGAAAEVALYAVDEGVLALTGYRTPDLVLDIEARGEHLVRGVHTRPDVGWLTRPGWGRLSGSHRSKAPSIRMGATSVSDRDMPRSDFRPTPLYLPSLETDGQGQARASFKLPDSLTAYRIMAVVVGKGDRYGNGEATVRAKLPAQIRPVVPAAIRAGDRFEVAAVASNNTEGAVTVQVRLEAEGLVFPQGNAPRKLRLEAGASERVTFPVEARLVGTSKMTFRLDDGEGLRDAAEVPLTVRSPVSLEASSLQGKTEAAALESVADLGAIRGDVGGLDLTVSSSPVAGLAPGLEQLVAYPYGCTEQLTSRLVPLVALRELARSLAVGLPEDAEQESQKAVEKILQNRRNDGRFGLWRGSEPSPWVTAYAYWGLSEARRRGARLPSAVFEEGTKLLLATAARWPEGKRQAAEATFALDVLVDLPEADDTTRSHALLLARQMADHRAELPVFARFQLLHALARLAAPADELAPVLREVEASLHLDGPLARVVEPAEWYPALLDTRARSSAMALRALLAAAPGHPMLEPLARGLIADRGPLGWRTTQETAWALLALDAYRQTLPAGGGGVRVSLGGEQLLSGSFAGPSEEKRTRVPIERITANAGAPVLFEALGGSVYYQARLRYAPRTLPTTPVSAGLEVMQRCHALAEDLKAEDGPATSAFRVGAWVRCEVEVSTPTARSFVVLDEPIPGGFELANPEVQGVPRRIREHIWGRQQQRELWPDRVVIFVDHLPPGVHRWSYAARATTAGTFVVPPTRIEEMYAPEVFGRTAARTIQIDPLPWQGGDLDPCPLAPGGLLGVPTVRMLAGVLGADRAGSSAADGP